MKIIIIIAVIILTNIFMWSLCRASSEADKRMKKMYEDFNMKKASEKDNA